MLIYAGDTTAHKIELSSVATSTPTVTLKRSGFTDVSITPTHQGIADATYADTWTYLVPGGDVAVSGDFTVTWSAPSAAGTLTGQDDYTVYTPYATITELFAAYGWQSTDTGAPGYQSTEEVQRAERMAHFMVDQYTGKYFDKYKKIVVVPGEGTDVLYIGERMVSFDRITENNVVTFDSSNSTSNYDFAINLSQTNTSLMLGANYNIIESSSGVSFPEWDFRRTTTWKNNWTYGVRGIFGYASVPQDVKDAVISLVNDIMCDDSEYLRRYVKGVVTPNWELTFSDVAFVGTGNFYADRILSRYRTLGVFAI